jgi:xanthine dehydrogenase molybdenum-binding subunit
VSAAVGRSVPKVDAPAKVRGGSRYVDDLVLPGMLYARLARATEAHAEVVAVDDAAAMELPETVAVLSSANLAERFGTLPPYDAGCHDFERAEAFSPEPGDARLLDSVVRFVGEPVAAVAATSDAAAKRAVELLEVSYRELEPVFDVERAREPGAPLLHADAPGNLAARVELRYGDPEAAMAGAATVIEGRWTTSKQKQAQLEPTCCLADPSPDGGVTVWAPAQSPHRARHTLAHLFGLRLSQVRVIAPAIGGAFGKGDALTAEPYAVALALATGRPVKLRFTRTDDFVGTESRHPSIVSLRAGFAADGAISGLHAKVTLDAGAYRSHSPRIAAVLAKQLVIPYGIADAEVEVEVIFTNTPTSGAFRGYGGPQAAFALEQVIDQGALAVGVDPADARALMLSRVDPDKPGARAPLIECIRLGREAIGWDAARGNGRAGGDRSAGRDRSAGGDGAAGAGVRRGVGMAAVTWKSGVADKPGSLDQSAATVLVNDDGSFDVLSAASDLGTGVRTTLAQIAADSIGVPLEAVRVSQADTAATPFDSGAFASRSLYRNGQAVQRAAAQCRDKILAYAGELLEAAAQDLELRDGWIAVRGAPRRGVDLEQVLRRAMFEGRDLHGHGTTPLTSAPTSAAQFAEVEVDVETGRVRVLRLVAVQDVGRAINPAIVEGQIQGGAHQGLGYALSEALVLDESTGATLTGSFMDYRLLTVADGPLIEPIVVEHPDPTGPFGAKGAGEPSIIVTAPAIANAIRHATGASVKRLPMTAEVVHRAIREARAD